MADLFASDARNVAGRAVAQTIVVERPAPLGSEATIYK